MFESTSQKTTREWLSNGRDVPLPDAYRFLYPGKIPAYSDENSSEVYVRQQR
jgi:GTPase SAR1 family protein